MREQRRTLRLYIGGGDARLMPNGSRFVGFDIRQHPPDLRLQSLLLAIYATTNSTCASASATATRDLAKRVTTNRLAASLERRRDDGVARLPRPHGVAVMCRHEEQLL